MSDGFVDDDGVLTPATEELLRDILAAKVRTFMHPALSMLLYDHLCTFSEEIRCVWKKKKTFILYIFIFIRYYAPLAMTVVAYGYFSTAMTRDKYIQPSFSASVYSRPTSIPPILPPLIRIGLPHRCAKWVLFLPLGTIIPLTFFSGILMVLSGELSTMYLFFELSFDTLIFILSMSRTIYIYYKHQGTGAINGHGSSLMTNLMRDGIFYFAVIFSMNIIWILMIMYAPVGARAVAALVTTTMICRITLNLRTTVYGPANVFEKTENDIPLSPLRTHRTDRVVNVSHSMSLSRMTGMPSRYLRVDSDAERWREVLRSPYEANFEEEPNQV
ncbi:hypothetical protein EW146_g1256 [Bondarzewia mesenterica]|uniref:DUF6533 domain-containing protein n=1 Tax=Bondarzewia mesenterica TaxID=1095465 RepID=A0A4S4M4F0_9AGAM|nr:hypothetical protein EW146_g1256 [Bondarzewia mesenterica]